MRILTLLGSAKKKGNTATALTMAEKELEAQGHEVERIYLNSKDIHGCLGCNKCREFPDEIACVQDDDANAILEKMIASDAVLFTSPIYFWGFTAQIKALIDRSYALVTQYHQPDHTSLMKGKRIGLLTTGGGLFENNAEGTFTAFDRLAKFYIAESTAELHIGKCGVPSELPHEAPLQIEKFVKSFVK